MFVRVTSTRNSLRKSVKVVESVREGYKVKQVMLLHIGVASNEDEIEKLKLIGKEFIAQETLKRESQSKQTSLFESESIEERLENIKKKIGQKKRGRKPTTTLENVTKEGCVSLAD